MARTKTANAKSKTATIASKSPFPIGISQPALRALAGAGLDHLEQLSKVTEASLLDLHGFGPDALNKLNDAMKEIGLSFAASSKADSIPSNLEDLWCDDRDRQGQAFKLVLEITEQPVAWAYGIWDELLQQIKDKNNRNRSIAAQLLCNLAKSDPAQRLLKDFPALFDVVADERFVTARHALQSMWKVGCVSLGASKPATDGRFKTSRGVNVQYVI